MGSIRGEGGAGGGGGGGGIADLVDDTTPQLGGNLDVNGFNVGGATPTQVGYLAATTAAGAALLDDANAAAQRTTLGLGTAAVAASGDFQAADAELTALAGLTSAADKGIQFTGIGTAATYDLTAAGKALLDDADASAQRATLGLGTAAIAASGDFQAANANLTALAGQTGAADKVSYWTAAATLALATLTAFGRSLCAAADAAGVRTLLGLGTAATTDASAYQAADAELTALAGLTSAADRLPYFTGSGTASLATFTAAGRALVDDADAAAQLVTLGAVGAASPVLTGTVVVRQTAGVAGTDEIQISHDGAKSIIRSKDGGIIFYDGPTNNCDWSVTTVGTFTVNGNLTFGGTLLSANFAAYSSGSFIRTAGLFGWCSGTPGATGTTTAIGQPSTGVVEINNGTLGQYRDFKARVIESTQTTGTAPLTVASTTVVTNLNADKLDGKDATDFAPCTQATLTAAASVALDFAAAGLSTLTTDQNTTFTTSNRAAGRQPYNLRIIGGGAHTLTFPAGWVWLSSTMPASIASGKTGRLSLECYGSADTDIVASFAVET